MEDLPWKIYGWDAAFLPRLQQGFCSQIARIVDRIDRPVVFCPELTTPIRKQGMPRKKTALPSDHAKDIAKTWAKERPDLDPLDYLLPIYLLRIARIVERSADQRARRSFGISSAELRVLLALRRAGGNYSRRPTDLFRALLVTSGAITKNVDRLAAIGLVKRQPDPSDKGGFLIHLTARGKQVADKSMVDLTTSSILSRNSISLSRTGRKAMIKFLEQILLDLESSEDEASG
jgi:DNA-binding MarR family transcriptional regulator